MPAPIKHPVISGFRVCIGCEVNKPFTAEHFTRDPHAPGGLTARCKECRYKKKREWETNNPDKVRKSNRAYYAKTHDTYLNRKKQWRCENIEKSRAINKAWSKKNPEKVSEIAKKWRAIPENRLATNLRARVRRCVQAGRLIYRDMELTLGYSIVKLRNHIESTFTDGMNWENIATTLGISIIYAPYPPLSLYCRTAV